VQEAGDVIGAIVQHAAPNSYSGQWLRSLLGESQQISHSIDRNGLAGSALFSRLPPIDH
jgi:hypothetical protein